MEDIDDCWDELVNTKPDVPLIDEFINYFNITWMNVERAATLEDQAVANAHFSFIFILFLFYFILVLFQTFYV